MNTKTFWKRRELYRRILRESPLLYRAARKSESDIPDAAALAASYVLGPALGGFTHWLLSEAVKQGKKRLYFLARDGYFFYKAALLFREKLNLPLDCRYLSCSRFSLRLPLYHLDHSAAMEYICRGGMDVTPEKILLRAGLSRQEACQLLGKLNLPFGNTQTVPYARLGDIRASLEHNEEFLSLMDRRSRESLPELLGYLKQEGLAENTEAAVVDSGWVGSMQKTLNTALELLGDHNPLEGFYWGLYELPRDVDPDQYHCYYFSPLGSLRKKVFFNNCLFETIFTAPHGMTLSYRKEGDHYQPVYAAVRPERLAFTQSLETQLMRYVSHLAELTPELSGGYARDLAVIRKLFHAFMGRPSPEEADVFGSLPFSDDVLEGETEPIAPLLTPRQRDAGRLFYRIPSVFRSGENVPGAWYEGSILRQGGKKQPYLWENRCLNYLRFLRKAYQQKREE